MKAENGKYLLYAQLILIALMFYFGNFPKIFQSPPLAVIFIIGIITALWAYYNMGSKNFSAFPEPRKGAKLIQEGIYKYVRHPMYGGIIVICFALFISSPSFLSFTIYALLCYVLDAKATMEENFLTKLHSQYKDYAQKTKKFIPFTY